MRKHIRAITFAVLALSTIGLAESAKALPDWLSKIIAQRQGTRVVGTIWETSYEGRRTFLFFTGVENYTLFAEDGNELCRVCCYASNVTSGSCSPRKIVYVRVLYPSK